MNKTRMKNKISQMLYKPYKPKDKENTDKEYKSLKELDKDIEKAVNELFGLNKKKKGAKKSEDKKEDK